MIDLDAIDAEPHFRAEAAGGSVLTRGVPGASFGHRLPGGDPDRPDGVHAAWQWDGQQLVAESDRFGIHPLYYWTSERTVSISPSMLKLLREGAPLDIDWPALAVFLHLGFFPGDDTVFRHIHVLPPQGRLRWRDGRLDVSGGYPSVAPRQLSRPAAVDAYIELFRAAIARRLPDHQDFAVPLSGGRDSRHIVLELSAQGRAPRFCITGRRFPPASNDDVPIAALLASRLGLEHVVVGPPPEGEVRSQLQVNIATNLTSPRRGWKLAVARHLEATVRASYDGIGGDMLSFGAARGEHGADLLEAGRVEQYCHATLRARGRWLPRMLPGDTYARVNREVAEARLAAEVRRHLDAPNPARALAFWNFTRRFNSTSPYGVYRVVPTVYAPYLDHALVEFLTAIPRGAFDGRDLHDEVIRRAYPRHADVPFEAGRPGGHSPSATAALHRDLVALLRRHRPRTFLRTGFALRRLALGLASRGLFSTLGMFKNQMLYLIQLEMTVTGTLFDADVPRRSP